MRLPPRGGRRRRRAPTRPAYATSSRALRRRSAAPRPRVAFPAPRPTLSGIHTPPRGDVLRPRRRRLASSARPQRRAHGAPRERRQTAPAGAGRRARYAGGVVAVQATQRSENRTQGGGLALGPVGDESGAAGWERQRLDAQTRSGKQAPSFLFSTVRLCV